MIQLSPDDLYTFSDGSSLSWTIGAKPSDATRWVEESEEKFTAEELSAVAVPPGKFIILKLPEELGPPYYHTHTFLTAQTLYEFLDYMYTFYNTDVHEMAKKVLGKKSEFENWAKVFKKRCPKGTTLLDGMGDHVFYEGVSKEGYLRFGS
jgi:hypothetical protein